MATQRPLVTSRTCPAVLPRPVKEVTIEARSPPKPFRRLGVRGIWVLDVLTSFSGAKL